MAESMTRITRVAGVAGAWSALALAPLAAAQGADDLYEVTVKMEMAGMPMQMPAMTQRSCVKKGASDADSVPHQDNCKVTDAKRSGNRLTFSMVCTGRDAMTGNGEFVYAGDGYSGMIRYKGKMDGQDTEMAQSIAGRRVGACTAR
jgi:hypothetical protein